MQLQKPFDEAALVAALKDKGVAEGEKIAADLVAVVCDWAKSSLAMESGLVGEVEKLAIPAIDYVQGLLIGKLQALVPATAPVEAAPQAPAQA